MDNIPSSEGAALAILETELAALKKPPIISAMMNEFGGAGLMLPRLRSWGYLVRDAMPWMEEK